MNHPDATTKSSRYTGQYLRQGFMGKQHTCRRCDFIGYEYPRGEYRHIYKTLNGWICEDCLDPQDFNRR